MFCGRQFHVSCQKTVRQLAVACRSRRTLVTQISPTTSLLRADNSDNEIFLVGTAHISEASAKEVTDLIQVVQPSTVFVELDPVRAARLRESSPTSVDGDDAFQKSVFEQALRNMLSTNKAVPGGIPGFGDVDMLKNAFSGFYNVLKQYGFIPGVEMKAAMKEASQINAKLVYGDRDINDTLRELRASLHMAMLVKAMSTPPPPELERVLSRSFAGGSTKDNIGEKIEAIKTRKYAQMMTEWMEQAIPDVADVMIHRRDCFMAQNLRKNCGQGRVVAVVGLAHVDGIEREWQDLEVKKVLPSR